MNWLMQPSFVDSGWRNSQVMGISEHFDLMTRVPPSYSAATTDFLYQPGAAAIEQASGNWGLLRSYGQVQGDLYRLPQNPQPGRPVAVCPATQPPGTAVRTYNVVAVPAPLTYNSTQGLSDANGIVYYQCPADQPLASCAPPSGWQPQPLVLRAGAGDCIKVNLRNAIPASTQINGVSDLQQLHPAGCKAPDYPPAPSNCGSGKSPCCLSSNTSLQIGLRPQLVGFDARAGGGANVGLNPMGTSSQPLDTAGPGQTVSYTWYAGNVDLKATTEAGRHIPIEFGSANLLSPDVLNHWGHGLFGALIVEPSGSTGWENGGGTSVKVTEADGSGFQEFVVFTQDSIPQTGGAIEGVNYLSELLPTSSPRFCSMADCLTYANNGEETPGPQNAACMFAESPSPATPKLYCPNSSRTMCSECSFTPATETFTACVGDSVRFRILHPGGINTNQVFEIYGHNWSESPYETDYDHCEAPTTQTNLWASQKQGTTNLCANKPYSLTRTPGDWEASLNAWQGSRMGQGPTNHLDILIAQAGGPFLRTGTYMYRSFPAMHFSNGLWGWFNVISCPEAPRTDRALKNQLPAGGGTR
jgi:manganese oxidase